VKLERLHDATPGAAQKPCTTSPVFALQRSAGNRATTQLLQRDPSKSARLAQIAKQLQVGVEARDIHLAMRVREGEDDGVRPGLNIVANLGARGRTGFVDASGRYRGDFLNATRDGELPAVAIMIGPVPFQEGDDSVLATLRHELVHAEHDRMILSWLTRWRGNRRAGFETWMRGQKASPADVALVRAGTQAKGADTELLAHLEGFAAVFDKTPPPSTTVLLKSSLPTAIEELRGAAERGWVGVDDAVKAAAEKRLAAFYTGLDASRQALLRDWLFYLHYRATTPWPKDATDDDARAAKLVWGAFQPYRGFLEWMLATVANVEFDAHALPRPANARPVDQIARPTPSRTVKVGSGKVHAYAGVGFRFAGDAHSHGISLSYEGRDAPQMRWLQFIWREVVPDQGPAVTGTLYHQQQAYPLTTNPSEPSQVGWNTDTATYIAGPQGAFYEIDNAVNRTAGAVAMFDEPSAPLAADVKAAFAAQPAGSGVTGRAHLVQYLVKDRQVLLRAEFEYEYRFGRPGESASTKPRLVSAQPATAIDPGPRARLHAQFRDLDYLP
jgi:hypothetical protein